MDPDPVVVAFGTALVGAVATDTWQQVKDAVTGLWRRVRPRQAIGTELELLRDDVLQARENGDAATVADLEQVWQLKVRQLLHQDPALAVELQRVLDTVLAPALPTVDQARVQTILTSTVSGHAISIQAGGNVNVVDRDQFNAGRDIHTHPR